MWWLIIILAISTSCAAYNSSYRVVSPAHLTQIPNVIVYEQTSQLVFTFPMPKFQRPSNYSLNETALLMNLVLNDIESDLQLINGQDPSRQKRIAPLVVLGAAAAGGFLLAGTISIGVLFSQNKDLKNYVDELRTVVVDYEQNLKVISAELKIFGGNMTALVEHYQSRYDRKLFEVIQVMEAKIARDAIFEARQSCSMQRIPSALVPYSELQVRINKLDEELRVRNKTVAIPLSEISMMYKAAIADCLFTEEMFMITITVPVTKVGNSWKLYQVIPVKFAFEGQTCSLHPNEHKLVAVSAKKIVEISPLLQRRCNFLNDLLCFVPEFQNDASATVKCAVGLMAKLNLEQLKQVCSFGCSDEKELVVQQIGYSEYIIVNAIEVVVLCGATQTTYNFSPIGAIYVHTHCNCSVKVNGQYDIDYPLFCQGSSHKFEMHAITPCLWTNFSHLVSWSDKSYTSLAGIDSNWHEKIPKMNLSQINFPHIPEPPVMLGLSFTHMMLSIMMFVITVIIIIVLVLCVTCLKSGC